MIYDKNKPVFIVRDAQFDRDLEVSVFKWNSNENVVKIRVFRFHYGDGGKDEMLEYVKKIINAMEPYL